MYCCDEHIELAIDMYVDEKELAPEIEKISAGQQELSTTCDLCENQAVYIVGNEHSVGTVDK
ncbi:CxxH/CxxC protein [Metabacillus malikii]|uniref:CxxH/CxxC protein (TIGR04129 family) n=1 Tax=Metabacillus malikii TaxID=1504265 RepID=A0ABT9ZF71_9BACI|nr:CxxH/CxxC protein [Metabacillus malikii]MDQ0230921.1 CxxH/CxxC protein (TIGR04129 family) [Metabacillus malikii]